MEMTSEPLLTVSDVSKTSVLSLRCKFKLLLPAFVLQNFIIVLR